MNMAQAAVLWPGAKDLAIETLEIDNPRADEVLVKVIASGICHTDMVMRDQGVPTPQPVVLGHEGAGIVEKVGDQVSAFKPGDRVAMSFATCGSCPSCAKAAPAYCYEFFPLNFFGIRSDGSTSLRKRDRAIHSHIFGQSSFSSHVVCSQRNLVKVPDAVPLEIAGPFGCGFQTGAGAVLNSIKVAEGSSVLVLGAGAVGMSAVMAAAYIAKAKTVITADLNPERLALAKTIGGTHTVLGNDADFAEKIRQICPNGVDTIIDTTGFLPLVEPCVHLLAPKGTLGLVAAYRADAKLTLDVMPFMSTGKKVQGIVEGDTDITTFIPQLLHYYKQGLFPVEKLITYFDFADINDAIEQSETGKVIKAIVRMADE